MLKLLYLLILGNALYQSYRKDHGLHTKAKVVHGVLLTCILLVYSGSFKHLGALVGHFNKVKVDWAHPVGIISGQLHLAANIGNAIAGAALVIIALKSLDRKESSRKWLLSLLVIVSLMEIIPFYRGWLSEETGPVNDYAVLALALFLLGLVSVTICYLYTRPFMKAFFTPIVTKSELEEKTDNQLSVG